MYRKLKTTSSSEDETFFLKQLLIIILYTQYILYISVFCLLTEKTEKIFCNLIGLKI